MGTTVGNEEIKKQTRQIWAQCFSWSLPYSTSVYAASTHSSEPLQVSVAPAAQGPGWMMKPDLDERLFIPGICVVAGACVFFWSRLVLGAGQDHMVELDTAGGKP